jgi:hypothetical protein
VLNKPVLAVKNATVTLPAGNRTRGNITISNIGYNSTAINVTAQFPNYQFLISVENVKPTIAYGENGYVNFLLYVPSDMEPGIYVIPLDVYENGKWMGRGYVILEVTPKQPQPPGPVCNLADLWWTFLVLLLGLLVSVWIHGRTKLKQREEAMKRKKPVQEDLFERYKPRIYAVLTMAVFFLIWVILLLIFLKCK